MLADIAVWLVRLIIAIPSSIVRGRRNRRIERSRESLEGWAAGVGWRYLANGSTTIADHFAGAPFRRGTSRELRHVLTGRDRGRPTMVIELGYYYSDGGLGDASALDDLSEMRDNVGGTCSIVIIELPASVPRLQVTREGMISGAVEKLGMRDLQLESEQFNKVFRINGDNDRFAYDILHPRMMEWLLTDERARRIGFRIDGPNLVVWRKGWLLEDDPKLTELIAFTSDLVDRVPSFVFSGRPPARIAPLTQIPLTDRWGNHVFY